MSETCSRDSSHYLARDKRGRLYCPKCLSEAGRRGSDKVHRQKRLDLLAYIREMRINGAKREADGGDRESCM